MLDQLRKVIEDLPSLIDDKSKWAGVLINRRSPTTVRATRELGDMRLCLNRYDTFSPLEAKMHTHDRPMAVMLIEGSYTMQIGAVQQKHENNLGSGFVVTTVNIGKGDSYEMINPWGMHSVAPITRFVYTITLFGKSWPKEMTLGETEKPADLPLSVDELHTHLRYFRMWCRDNCRHLQTYYSEEHDNYYCSRCKSGMGNEYYEKMTGRVPGPR